LEDRKIELPLRLEGEAPWKVKFQNLDQPSSPPFEKTLQSENSRVKVDNQGRYEIISVEDASCPGSIDKSANIFNVSWIPRPSIASLDGFELNSVDVYAKPGVCEGDEDGLEVKFAGTPPYTVRYEQRNLNAGPNALSVKSFTAPLNSASIQMDTSKPGDCSYKFTELGDNLYNHDSRKHAPLVVNQKVNPRPFARFASPGHIYGFCKEESNGEEVIPIALEGVPPFSLEISIKHHSSSKAEVVSIPNINSNKHNLPIPRRHLDLGQHVVSIHKVRDARGCQRTIESDASSVRVAVSDVPTIIPLESKVDYCVGERISYSLSGQAPFEVLYTFDGTKRKATSRTTNFRRIAEAPGEFTITGVSDAASGKCEAHKDITKVIHEMPSVKISKGLVSVVDIHEGGEAEIQFEFWGTPPFEFT
jgi:nucleoporin POM152